MFQVRALPSTRFRRLFGQSEEALRAAGVIVRVADSKPGYPCRVSLRDCEPGSRMLLLNYEHQDAATPYRSAHAIFVRDGAEDARLSPGEVPALLATRPLSVRAFSQDGMLLDGVLSAGADAPGAFEHLLANPKAAYLHVHFATFGCYAARVDRVA